MLKEALEHLLTPCPRPWRQMGYLREQIAIDARLARNRSAWAPHLEATRRELVEAADRCRGRRCALLLGAGLHHDVPLAELAARFERVVLADIVHRPFARRAAERISPAIRCVEFDASGVARRIFREGAAVSDGELMEHIADAEIGLPAACEGEPDLVVSANLCSQLLILPLDWIERHRDLDTASAGLLSAAAAKRHLRWLAERTGDAVLVSDFERRRVSLEGTVVSAKAVPGMDGLRSPDAEWTWRIAPIPELSRSEHTEHRVGVWRRKPFADAEAG